MSEQYATQTVGLSKFYVRQLDIEDLSLEVVHGELLLVLMGEPAKLIAVIVNILVLLSSFVAALLILERRAMSC